MLPAILKQSLSAIVVMCTHAYSLTENWIETITHLGTKVIYDGYTLDLNRVHERTKIRKYFQDTSLELEIS